MMPTKATTRVRFLLALLLVALFASPDSRAVESNLVVAGAWIRQPPPGSDVAAVYFSLLNAGTAAVKLTGAQCSLASMVMLHESQESGGQSRMRATASVSLAPGASLAFMPGGRHIMLHGLARPLKVGERVPIVLLFDGGIKLHILALVRPLSAG
jgi:copper(I)-binding protein